MANNITRITASVPLTEEQLQKLDEYASKPQFYNNHGNPSRAKVIQAALDRMFKSNGSAPVIEAKENPAKVKALELLGVNQPSSLEKDISELKESIDGMRAVLRMIVEHSMSEN